jgi:hypothetical protein
MVALIAVLLNQVTSSTEEDANSSDIRRASTRAINAESLCIACYSDATLDLSISVDQGIVLPRRVGIFRLKTLNEVLLRKVEVGVYNPDLDFGRLIKNPVAAHDASGGETGPAIRSNESLLSSSVGLFSAKIQAGRIVSVRTTEIRINLFKHGSLSLTLIAERSVTEADRDYTSLNNVRLFNHKEDFLVTAPEAVYQHADNRLEIQGQYMFKRRDMQRRGKGIFIQRDGAVTFLNTTNS